jgi:hypothetical protein
MSGRSQSLPLSPMNLRRAELITVLHFPNPIYTAEILPRLLELLKNSYSVRFNWISYNFRCTRLTYQQNIKRRKLCAYNHIEPPVYWRVTAESGYLVTSHTIRHNRVGQNQDPTQHADDPTDGQPHYRDVKCFLGTTKISEIWPLIPMLCGVLSTEPTTA